MDYVVNLEYTYFLLSTMDGYLQKDINPRGIIIVFKSYNFFHSIHVWCTNLLFIHTSSTFGTIYIEYDISKKFIKRDHNIWVHIMFSATRSQYIIAPTCYAIEPPSFLALTSVRMQGRSYYHSLRQHMQL
jgi:hypothetical protein